MGSVKWPASPSSPHVSKAEKAWDQLFQRKDLGFLGLPSDDQNWERSVAFAHQVRSATSLVVLGMGGSGLGGHMLLDALAAPAQKNIQFIYDSHPTSFQNALQTSDQNTAWLVVSKSGTTLEVLSQLQVLVQFLREKSWDLKSHVFVITEATGNPLHTWALKNELALCPHPLDVGGRFSVLSPVGLVPGAWADLPLQNLRKGALLARAKKEELSLFAAHVLDSFERKETISVFWPYCRELRYFTAWIQQLWAESLGKSETGLASTPLPSFGTCDQHSVLQQYMEGRKDKHIFLFRENKVSAKGARIEKMEFTGLDHLNSKTLGDIYLAESLATEQALRQAGRSVSAIEFDDFNGQVLGELIFGFEIVVGLLGAALQIDAFNQPGVEAGKVIAHRLLKEGL